MGGLLIWSHIERFLEAFEGFSKRFKRHIRGFSQGFQRISGGLKGVTGTSRNISRVLRGFRVCQKYFDKFQEDFRGLFESSRKFKEV